MANVLLVRSDWDLATRYQSTYLKFLVDYAIERTHQVKDLYNDVPNSAARLLDFENTLETFQPNIVIMGGHGNKTTITGQDLEILLKTGVNDDLMSGKITALLTCSAGIELGPSMISKTAQQFYGYLADFTFVYNPNFETRPLDDPWAKAFFDCMLATGYAILLGKTPKEVYDLTIQRYDYWWNYWIGQNDPMADDILTWLNWDRSSFIALTPTGLYGPLPKLTVPLNLSPYVLPLGIAAAFFLLSRDDK